MTGPGGELIVYRTEDGRAQVQLRAVRGTVWLTQAQIAELYDTSVPNIVQIMRRVTADGEVTEAIDERRRADGAERAAIQERNDLRALASIERGRLDGGDP